jgi:Kef-type K+ transport system membrane component KefB
LTYDLLYVGLLLVVVKLSEDLFEKMKLAPLVGAVLGGLILGKSVLNVVQPTSTVSFFVELGVIMLLFLAGADEFDLESAESVTGNKRMFAATFLSWVGPSLVVFAVLSYLVGSGTNQLLFLSAVLGMSSVAPLSRVLRDFKISKTMTAVNVFTFALVVEVIGLIGSAITLQLSYPGANHNLTSSLVDVLEIAVFLVALYLIRKQLSRVLHGAERFVNSREAVFALMISVVLILGYFGESIGFNAAIVALFLGYMFSDYIDDRPQLLERLHGVTYGFFEPLFFGGLGLSVSLAEASSQILLLLVLLATMLGSKMLFGYVSGLLIKAKQPLINAVGASFKGGVDGALLLSGLTAGIISSSLYSVAIIDILIVILVLPVPLKQLSKKITDEIKADSQLTLSHSYVKWFAQGTPAIKIAKMLPDLIVKREDRLRVVVDEMVRLRLTGGIVVDENRKPVGTVILDDIINLGEKDYNKLSVADAMRRVVVSVNEDTPAWELLDAFKDQGIPLVAVTDAAGQVVGTASEREFLLYMTAASSEPR